MSIASARRLRIVFMGTPDFAVPSLNAILRAEEVTAVVTQPDRPQGRGMTLTPPPIKEIALQAGLPVYQPARLRRDAAFIATLSDLAPDAIVVVAFGQILPEAVLKIPSRGCINLHASLLPKYRGAAPIQWALICGEQETGVTTLLMDAGIDTGPILLQQSVPIEISETADCLARRLSHIGADLLGETLTQLKTGRLTPTPQTSSMALAPLLKKEDGRIRWEEPSYAIFNRWRGVFLWPGTTTFYRKEYWKVPSMEIGEREGILGTPGEVLEVSEKGVAVAAGRGSIIITRLQLAGGKPISPLEYQAGHPLGNGSLLGLSEPADSGKEGSPPEAQTP